MDFGRKVFLLVLSCSILPAAWCLETNESSHAEPRFLTSNVTFSVVEGETVTFPCIVSVNKGPVVLWYKGTQLLFARRNRIAENTRYSLGKRPHYNLTIEDITLEDEDEFICRINQPTKAQVNKLFVNIPPMIVHHSPEWISADLMQNVTLNCSAEGKPEPIITWTKESGTLPNGDPSFRGKSLILTKLDGRHNGAYTCTASNGAGKPASVRITLNIEFGARLLREGPMVEHTGLGENLVLMCAFEGNPSATAIWYKDGKAAVGAHAPNRGVVVEGRPSEDISLLRITKVSEDDLGDYLCFVNNTLGSANATYHVTGLPRQPTIDHTTHAGYATQYTLRWTIASHQLTELFLIQYRMSGVENVTKPGEWKTVEVKGDDGNPTQPVNHIYSHSYVITDLTPSTAYEIKIAAKNSFGWGDESLVLVMETRDEDPTPPPPTQPAQVTRELLYTLAANSRGNNKPNMNSVGDMSGSDATTYHPSSLICVVIAAFIGQHWLDEA